MKEERTVTTVKAALGSAPKRLRTAAYARVSSGKESMLHSLSAQVSFYSGFIQSNPAWQYCGVYADEDFTGTRSSRPEFQRLLADCRAGKLDLIVTKSISRFARNTVTLLDVVRELKALGIDCYFEKENIHTLSGDGELMLTILASYAQEESLSVSENCKWRIRHDFQDGRLVAAPPYGYRMSEGKLEIVPEEEKVVSMIFASYLSGMGRNAIMKQLKKAGIVNRTGKPFHEHGIEVILANEKYVGDALLQKYYSLDHLSKKRMVNCGELPMYYIRDDHEAIVDRETYERVQKERMRRSEARKPGQQKDSCFLKKIVCGHCGHFYRRKAAHGITHWACRTYMERGRDACPCKQIPESALMHAATEALGMVTFDEAMVRRCVERIEVPSFNHLVFCLTDGRRIEQVWQDRPRRESWTAEMRERAREQALRREKR